MKTKHHNLYLICIRTPLAFCCFSAHLRFVPHWIPSLFTHLYSTFFSLTRLIWSFYCRQNLGRFFELYKRFRCSRRSITFFKEVVFCHVPAKVQFVLQGPLHFGQSCHIFMYCFIVHELGLTYLSFGKGQCVLQRLLFLKFVVILHMCKLAKNLYLQNNWEWSKKNHYWPIAYSVNVISIAFVPKFLTL
jgi:hypothetical protein